MAADVWANTVGTLDYSNFPGGSYGWAMANYNQPVFMLGQAPFAVTNWLANGFMLYRCYVVFSMTSGLMYILALPFLLYLASIATAIAVLVQTNVPNSSIFSLLKLGRLTLGNFSINAALNIIITALISVRLIIHQLTIKRTMGTDSDSLKLYTSLWTILVESSALYAVFSLMFIVTFGINHPSGIMFLPILGQIQVIAPLLVALRISRGRALTTQSMKSTSRPMTTMQFDDPDHHARSEGQHLSTIDNRISRQGVIETQVSLGELSGTESTDNTRAYSSEDEKKKVKAEV
ncbi:hypothetical protein D9611_006733 [Ephemerocybe angulata]|uniref:Uncharacterized protein n=1 Tax=Ephemerocybe angulata TaxID=980116 RepID=A0A8H5C7K3_9AGAR|nr:hypothetical protein D9611_006733 [Tulosesus angulatus]